jgi:carotenoid cleavage dioxygenase-like enzyme
MLIRVDSPPRHKVCPITGEMFFFGYDPMKPVIQYTVISREGVMEHPSLPIPLPGNEFGCMMHDMIITRNFSVLFDQRLNFDFTSLAEGGMFCVCFVYLYLIVCVVYV